jgi:hypothetical protein
MEVGVLFYSDGKIALELNLKEGHIEIPKINVDKIKEIKDSISKRWSIVCEDYVDLCEEDNIKYILVGEWEERLKSMHGFKTIWFNIKRAIEKTKENDKKTLTFLEETYREVLLPSHERIGIAKIDECIKYNLITRAYIITKKDKILTFSENNHYFTHLIELKLGEELDENLIITKKIIKTPKKVSLSIIKLKEDSQSLTFLEDNNKNLQFIPINLLNCPILNEIKEVL